MLQQRITKLSAHIEKLLDRLLVAHTVYATLRPMMVDSELLDRISREKKGAGFDTIRHTLYWNLVQELVKIVADGDDRVPSIYNVRNHLADEQVKAHLEEKYSVWASSAKDSDPVEVKEFWKYRNKQSEESRRQSFTSTYNKAMKESEELLKSDALKSMVEIRDKFLAHNELKFRAEGYEFVDIKDYGLKYGDERIVLEKTSQIFDGFFILTKSASFEWERFKAMINRDVEQFWKK